MPRFGGFREGILAGEKNLLGHKSRAVVGLSQDLAGQPPEIQTGHHRDHGQHQQRSCKGELSFQAETHLSAPPRTLSACCGVSSD